MQIRLSKLHLSPAFFATGGALPSSDAPAAIAPVEAPASVDMEAVPGESLSRALWLSGHLRPLPLCGGLGRCGRCRVRFPQRPPQALPAEEAVFSEQDLAAGWRLACRRTVPAGACSGPDSILHLELPVEDFLPEAPAAPLCASAPAAGQTLSVAVDLGTTSVHWQALNPDEARLAEGQFLNPQAGAGADIMSRLAEARTPEGRARLAGLARESLRRVVGDLEAGGHTVQGLCLAANTAMTDIFLDRDVAGLCVAPYRAAHAGHETAHLPGLPPIYIPPLPAPFVGGDMSAGLAALVAARTPRPFVLADLGTNGELALMTAAGELWLTSVPLGPALEGIGPECGQLAGPDVVTSFSLGPSGLTAHSPDGACGAARGISATGYLSLLALLRQVGLLDASGLFTDGASAGLMPLARKIAAGLKKERGGMRLLLPRGLWLAAADVEELLKVKAAFALALEALLTAAQVLPRDLPVLCLAGALGQHVRPDDLERLGFVPAGLGPRIRPVGNAALDGAALLALHPEQREALARICAGARLLPLVEDPDFHHAYLRHMRFGV